MPKARVCVLDAGNRYGTQLIVSYEEDPNGNGRLLLYETEQSIGSSHVPSKHITLEKYELRALFYYMTEIMKDEEYEESENLVYYKKFNFQPMRGY